MKGRGGVSDRPGERRGTCTVRRYVGSGRREGDGPYEEGLVTVPTKEGDELYIQIPSEDLVRKFHGGSRP